uniref:Uncharacterized protein n=1 Tax=virus sp. ctCsQ3 TaxID=2826794 RepID=A0A8S5R613_9VIRU|nr:MAG TPA: hypothetical protein [virus sp. ctCsQ3]
MARMINIVIYRLFIDARCDIFKWSKVISLTAVINAAFTWFYAK